MTTSVDSQDLPEPPGETLLEQLERRQNHVLAELEELDRRIAVLLGQCQSGRAA